MRLAHVFGDHAVLQRELPIPVWGRAAPHRHVRIALGAVNAESFTDATGRFLCHLPPQPAGGPHTLAAATLDEAGQPETTVRFADVYVGEVWVASGQSNMGMNVVDTGDTPWTDGPSPDGVRMLNVGRDAGIGEAAEVEGEWNVAGPTTTPYFSAAAYYFAVRLHRELGVAVGILHSSWGGTFIEAWTSRATLLRNPEARPRVIAHTDNVNSPAYWTERLRDGPAIGQPVQSVTRLLFERYCRPNPDNAGLADGWAAPDFDDESWPTMPLPLYWSCHGHCISGVFWFRRVVNVPPEFAGRDLRLELGAADKHDFTYWNGEEIGRTGEGFDDSVWNTPRVYTVPGRLVKAGANVVACRVYSFAYGGGLIGPTIQAVPGAVGDGQGQGQGEGEPIDLRGPWRYKIESDFGLPHLPALQAALQGPGNPNTPHILFDRMIRPLIPYGIRGAIWYQGESNAGDPQWYRRLMVDMIRDWRFHWMQGDFPFIQVQLAGYRKQSDYAKTDAWPYLREAQLLATGEPGVGMISAIDIGEAVDIHPHNKREVGERLAGWALAKTYRLPRFAGQAHGPHFTRHEVEGKTIRLYFDGAEEGGGLSTRDGQPPRTFHVAGFDRVFHPAEARIDGRTVVVESAAVESPVNARYAWSDNPEAANLTNAAGLPASSFRTDGFPFVPPDM